MNEYLQRSIGSVAICVTILGILQMISSCAIEEKRSNANITLETLKLEQTRQQNLNDCLAKGNTINDCSFYLNRK